MKLSLLCFMLSVWVQLSGLTHDQTIFNTLDLQLNITTGLLP